MKLRNRFSALALAATILTTSIATVSAQVPQTMNYQGRVVSSGVNFNGTGHFKFALVDGGVNANQTATATPVLGAGGSVDSITIALGGSGYVVAPAVTILGDGTGAIATATVAGGVVTAITVTAAGAGYTGVTSVSIAPPPPDISVTTIWSNDGSSTTGNEPVASVAIPVTNGLYSTALADTAAGMVAFGAATFSGPVSLRVWFDDGVNGFQLLTPDQPLGTVPYAFRAGIALSVADGSVNTAQLADGAITSGKLALGAVTIDQLNFTGAPNVGQVLGFDGANLTWITPAGGGGGGGSLTLPFSGLAASTGALFSVNNTGTTGDPWAIYGHSQTNLGVFGQTHGNAQAGVLGRNDGATGVNGAGVFGYASTQAAGVLAISEFGNGVSAEAKGPNTSSIFAQTLPDSSVAGRFHHNGSGTALTAEAGSGWAFFGRSQSGIGVFGQSITGGNGVLGRNESNTGHAVHGFANAGAIGVRGDSVTGDGVVGNSTGAGRAGVAGFSNQAAGNAVLAFNAQGTGVFAKTETNSATAGFFWNSAGGDAIRTTGNVNVGGTTTTRILTITGGADVAEPFQIGGGEIPKGSVVVIDEERPGALKQSSREYDRRVAGIVSGANGVKPGIALHQEGVLEGGQHVALTGRVYVLADASSGGIQPGDLLTTSATPGHAMRVADHTRSQGAVLGKAMTPLAEGTGYVLVLVTLQ